MADNLIFPIGFDLEKGVKDAQAQMDSVLRRLQKTVDGKPLTIPMSLDASKFTTFEAALRGSIQHITDDAKNLKAALDSSLQTDNSANINRITEAMRNLEAAWKALPNNQKFDINDRLTPKAQEMVRQFNELATASSTYGQTLSQIAGKIKRVADEEAKANQKRNDGYAKLRKTLGAQENSIANLSAKIKAYQQILNSKEIGSKSFERVAEKIRKLTEQLDKAKVKVAELTGKAQSGATRQSAAVQQVNQEFSKQDSYLTNLLRKTAALWSINQVGNFITQVREVTAQFELQRVSLGAILQDQNKANQLFSEIKSFALKSPVSILDLTKYTKQLAAYKIGYDELFVTTKKLTDVSVGLGVSMDRVVLAYGQVRATGYLRASEIRQFTEMGVPIVEELASKLSKMNGELVTAAQVMDLVSKRGISFEMVKEVFDDMTSAGGIFYNMQEKQGNTLYGLWAKLGDAASVMYSEIGNTGPINDGMKSLISGLTSLMKNWRLVAGEAMVAVASFGAYKAIQALTVVSTEASTKATQRLMAAKNALTAAQNRLTAAQRLGNNAAIRHANLAVLEAQWTVKAAAANRLAANATNVWTAAKYRLIAATSQLKAAMAGNWIMLTVAAVAAIAVAIGGAIEKATRLKRALDDIEASTVSLQNQSVGRFEHLAEAAVNAADGSKRQRDALAELSRTYGDILPQDALKLENLKRLNHNYTELTTSLKEYIAVQQKNKGMEEISSEYGGKINEASKKAIDSLVEYAGVERDVAINIVGEMQRDIQEKLEKGERDFRTTGQKLQAAAAKFGVHISNSLAGSITTSSWYDNWYDHIGLGKATNEFQALTEAVAGQYNELDEWNKRVDASTGATGAWSKELEAAKKKIDELSLTNPDGSPIDNSTFQGSQIKANETMKVVADLINNDTQIKDAIKKKEVEWNQDWIHLVGSVDKNNLMDITTVNFDAIIEALNKKHPELADKIRDIQQEWGNVAPTNATAVQIKYKTGQIADAFKVSMDKMQKYLWDGSGSVDDYLKRLKDQQAELNARLKEKQQQLVNMGVLSKWWNKLLGKDIEAEVEQMKKEIKALDTLVPFVTGYTVPEKNKNKGRKSDTRLQVLQEVAQTLATINKEYDDLAKKEGASKALADIKERFKEVLAYTNKIGGKFGLNFDFPTEFKTLQEYRNAILKVMQSLKGLPKGSEKTILDFKTMIGKADSDYLQKQIEKQLKELSDRISRTKTAKEFYEKILKSTGDANLALNLTTSIYGEDGQDLKKQAAQQVKRIFSEWKIDMPLGIVDESDNIDYKALREFAVKAKETRAIGEGVGDELIKIAENGEKELSRVAQEGAKLLLKYDEIAQQRVNIEQEASEKIKALRDAEALYLASNASAEQKAAFTKRTNNAVAGVEADRDLELFKLKSEYLRYFSAIHSLTNKEANYVRDTFRKALFDAFRKGAISADKFKKEMAALNEQFDKLLDTSSLAMNFMSGGFDGLINKVKEMADEVENVGLEISRMRNKDGGTVMKIEDFSQGQKDYMDKMLKLFGNENTGNSFQSFFDKMGGDSSKMGEMFNKMGQGMKAGAGKMASAVAMVDMIIQMVNATIKGIAQIRDQLNEMRSEDNQLGGTFWDAFEYLENFNKYAYSGWEKLKSGDFVGASFDTVSSIISIFGTEQAQRIKRINKRIKEQQKAIEQLEYTYGRLEKAAEKLFGSDYIDNYNQQLKDLQAQQEAYLKQAEAEKSKGKKEDEEKTQEYLDKARDTADQIADMQEDLIEHFTGSSRADIARQMAQSWIDARASMSDTFAAIKGDYQDLIKNMLVETMAAKIIENAFSQVWKDVDERLKDNDVEGAVNAFMNGMDTALTNADDGMEVWWKAMEARGFDMKNVFSDMDSEYTGIAKSVAGATSEEINNVAAIGNTLMYYVSPIPRIDENLARVVAIMEGRGASSVPQTTSAGWTDWQQQAMDNYNAIARNTADTVVECRRAAEACERIASTFKVKGSTKGLNVFLNS